MNRSEHDEQVALAAWAERSKAKYPALRWLFAIPNGACLGDDAKSRAIRMKYLKAEGLKTGVYDLFLPSPRGGYAGLFVEMKIGGNKPTADQQEFGRDMRAEGYAAVVCYSFEQAQQEIKTYLDLKGE